MKLGIVGLPNVGKSTLFNAITQAGAESATTATTTLSSSNTATATDAATTTGNANESTGSKVLKGLGGLLKK